VPVLCLCSVPRVVPCQGHYGDAVALINRSEVVMCQVDALPIDLRVRRGE